MDKTTHVETIRVMFLVTEESGVLYITPRHISEHYKDHRGDDLNVGKLNVKVRDFYPKALRLRVTFEGLDYRDYFGNPYHSDGMCAAGALNTLKLNEKVLATQELLDSIYIPRIRGTFYLSEEDIEKSEFSCGLKFDPTTQEKYLNYHIKVKEGSNTAYKYRMTVLSKRLGHGIRRHGDQFKIVRKSYPFSKEELLTIVRTEIVDTNDPCGRNRPPWYEISDAQLVLFRAMEKFETLEDDWIGRDQMVNLYGTALADFF